MTRDGESPEEVGRYFREAEATAERHERENRALPALRPFAVDHDSIIHSDVEELQTVLAAARSEAHLQSYLSANPLMLVQPLGGGHGRWVIPSQRLGAEHVPDFLLAELSSLGMEWTLVELESPLRPLFTKGGDPARYLNHAIRQITDWRTWLTTNRAYATQPSDEGGLGLVDIDRDSPAWIIIGRRRDCDPADRQRRRELGRLNNIRIHTYDWLVDAAEARVADLERWRRATSNQPENQ